MKEIKFPDWSVILARMEAPERRKSSFAITIRWYLSFCRRSRAGVNVQSARDFIAQAEAEKRPEAWQLEQWKEGIRWFFRAAKQAESGSAAPAGEEEEAVWLPSRLDRKYPNAGKEWPWFWVWPDFVPVTSRVLKATAETRAECTSSPTWAKKPSAGHFAL